ncbi:hypothetical protein EDD16DRAFT_1523021 [Pisolithus croceorrhizus]|nr:hypothetical protein EDD16DRAFT_1523021 [Pisolithus croceorrhizus]
MIWSETEWLMEEPVQQHSSWKGQAACEEGCHNTWAGPSIVKYQTYNSCTGPAMIWSETAQLMEGPLQQPQTVLFMHWPGHDVESDGATHGGASAAGGKGRHSSWAGLSIVKHQTVQLMHWPGHDMESDGATNGGASAAGEEGWHSSWAGPCIVKHQTIELMLWPGHDGESDGAAHGGASAAALVLAAFQSPAKSASASLQIMGGASAEGVAAIWSEREIFCLSLISLSSSSFPVTSQMCFGIPTVDGGAGAAGGGGWQNSWACPSMANHQKIQLMHWCGCDMDLISLSSSSCPGTSPSCIGILTIDGGASAAAQYDGYVPTGWRMQLTDKIVDYMKSCFWEEVLTGQRALPDISIPLLLTKETMESLQYPEITAPTVIVDGSGNVKLRYLPGALDSGHQRQIWNSLSRMAVPLKDSIKPSGTGRWWKDKALFQEIADLKGSIDLSPGWYQQGRGPPNFHPEVLRLLKSGQEQNGMRGWVDEMSEFHVLLSGTLVVIHPPMYASGREVLIRLGADAQQWGDTEMSSILPIWNLVYNSISIMANRATPYHRDVNGQQQWLDMLIMFRYNPGTIIAMPGSVLEHGVGYADGNCTCLAYYMRQNVHHAL